MTDEGSLPTDPEGKVGKDGRCPSDPGCQPTASAAVPASSQSGIPNAGHWDTTEGCRLAEEYSTKTRADLCHGELSDFALANAVFMADRFDLDLIVWQTAAKERIRWLSAQLARAGGPA